MTLPGGALVCLLYPLVLLFRNRSWSVFLQSSSDLAPSLLIGTLFLLFLLCLGSGMNRLGALGASIGFGLYQGMQIGTSQFIGLLGGEWRGVGERPRRLMQLACSLLLLGVGLIATARQLS